MCLSWLLTSSSSDDGGKKSKIPSVKAHLVTFSSKAWLEGGFAAVSIGPTGRPNEAMRVHVDGPCCIYFGYNANQVCIAGVGCENHITQNIEVRPDINDCEKPAQRGDKNAAESSDEPMRMTRKLSVALTATPDLNKV